MLQSVITICCYRNNILYIRKMESFCNLKTGILLLFLLRSVFSIAQNGNPDSLPCMGLPFTNVRLCATDEYGNSWLICGADADSIILVKPDKVKLVSQQMHLPEGIRYTCLLPVDRHTILLGTEGDYIYMLRNRRFVKLDKSYGLNDSTILSMEIDRANKFLFVRAPNAKYILQNGSTKKDFRFQKIDPSNYTSGQAAKFLRRYFRRPLQKAICDAFSEVDLSFRNQKYLGNKELEKLIGVLEPGDILIKRNDFQVSNLGIAGFWTHSAIYLGTLTQLDRYFEGIPMLNGQLPSEYILENYGEVYRHFSQKGPVIIEAIGKGVVVNPLEHIARVDYFAGLRPNLAKEELFRSILTSFSFYNLPYDFLFDFSSEDAVVCSELIYKSFSETPDKKGLILHGNTREGAFFFYPNDIASQYCQQSTLSDAALKLVVFYDGGAIRNQRAPVEFCQTLEAHKIF